MIFFSQIKVLHCNHILPNVSNQPFDIIYYSLFLTHEKFFPHVSGEEKQQSSLKVHTIFELTNQPRKGLLLLKGNISLSNWNQAFQVSHQATIFTCYWPEGMASKKTESKTYCVLWSWAMWMGDSSSPHMPFLEPELD